MVDLSVDIDGDPAPPAPRAPAWRRIIPVLAVVLAFVVGVAVGRDVHDRSALPAPQGGPVGGASLIARARCALQIDSSLWLGVEVVNQGPGSVVLQVPTATAQLGGLGHADVMWAACGQLIATPTVPLPELAEGASLWVSGIFPVTVDCPSPYPLQFTVTYTGATGSPSERDPSTGDLGFNDLGDVPYTGCA